jgi:hypothetical protein
MHVDATRDAVSGRMSDDREGRKQLTEEAQVKKQALQVTLEVREPSVVALTVGDKVQLDRLTPSPRGYLAERHGALLGPGVAQLALEPGCYFFKTLSAANLKVVRGGVDATVSGGTKGGYPDPPGTAPVPPESGGSGDATPGEMPGFTIEPSDP